MTDDIEKTLKDFINSPESPAGLHLSADEIRVMLDRLVTYRKRLHDRQHQHDLKIGKLRSELADLQQSIRWARERLDVEGCHTGFSRLDVIETSLLMKAIEERRGRIIAKRMFYGTPPSTEVAEETLGVLKAAIEEARREHDTWFGYLATRRKYESWKWSKDWMDWDGAAYELGCALGLFDPKKHPFQTKVKHVFWTNNPVGNALHECLNWLARVGIMERRDEPDIQFRWNSEFQGTWEKV